MGFFDKVKKAIVREAFYDGVDWDLRTRGLKGTAEVRSWRRSGAEHAFCMRLC